jgi:hypothetical protein
MSEKTFEADIVCRSCHGTGLYMGMGERDGAAVVCHTCRGTGREFFTLTYEEFDGRKPSKAKWVYEVNPGIRVDANGKVPGGMPYEVWAAGKKFERGMEMREHTCPAWWYQCAPGDKKPDWDWCQFGRFADCHRFAFKQKCWERFDKEQEGKP